LSLLLLLLLLLPPQRHMLPAPSSLSTPATSSLSMVVLQAPLSLMSQSHKVRIASVLLLGTETAEPLSP
jgi:hypothetical protein